MGTALHRALALTEEQIRWVGAKTSGRTLLFGGALFALAGLGMYLGVERSISADMGYLLTGIFVIVIIIPTLVYSVKELGTTGHGSRSD